jgi:exonuclease VII small subunit
MRQMWQDGVEKAKLGQTTLEEVAKVTAVVAASESQRAEERDEREEKKTA